MLRLGGFAAGIVVVVVTLSSVYTTVVVPRATSSRLLRAISKALGRITDRLVRLLPSSSRASLDHAVVVAGSSVFTLGIATFHQRSAEALEVVVAAGLLVVALASRLTPEHPAG